MRILAVAFSCLRVELARERAGEGRALEGPLGIVVTTAEARAEHRIHGGTRLDEVSPEARSFGIRAGMTVAAARAKASHLQVRGVSGEEAKRRLIHIAERGLRYGRTVAVACTDDGDRGAAPWGDMVLVDVTGCALLHHPSDRLEGERILARAFLDEIESLGLTVRAAIAEGPRLASMLARYGRAPSPEIVPLEETEATIGELPLGALPLEEACQRWLAALGLHKIAELRRLPRKGLGHRLGTEGAKALPLAFGLDGAPLVAHRPPNEPEEELELDDGIDAAEALLFVAKALCDRMEARLDAQARAASGMALDVRFDRALLRDGHPASAPLVALSLASPVYRAADLFAILRAKLESYQVPSPILGVRLVVKDLVPKPELPTALFETTPEALLRLPRLVAELSAELGAGRVGMLALSNAWSLEKRNLVLPYGVKPPYAPPTSGLEAERGSGEPLRILATPFVAPYAPPLRLLIRLESVEWWRGGGPQRRDEISAWIPSCEAMGWVEIDRMTGEAKVRGWIE